MTGRFQKGQSGNPRGKQPGLRSELARKIDGLLEDEAEALISKAIDLAKAGDIGALRLCLERLAPVRKDRPVVFPIPEINSTADVVKASAALLQAVASGELTPSEAAELGKLVEAHVRAIEVTEIQDRLVRLEDMGMGGKR
ncbi:hypothetical protein GCM10007036_31070 [Alsobacter metallidurans]|uniref:DUF5681 domain-containing protein n=1 Tax=Alsobacter metallidurans TaxID=340221 RepID=A0A917IA38_9HYPH|nr:DUF5681 domain-containing protein [Alsobacter metallidurans]GGH24573.1 hypothetical protein GCM10007036_31070 [Alsobacter metallidurans]